MQITCLGLGAGHAGAAARARLQAPVLRQCMQAFKAAQAEAQLDLFRRFLRLHQDALGLDSQIIDSHQVCGLCSCCKLPCSVGHLPSSLPWEASSLAFQMAPHTSIHASSSFPAALKLSMLLEHVSCFQRGRNAQPASCCFLQNELADLWYTLLQVEAMWEETHAAAAEQQKVLWSVELEGERALHYFETLPPEAACAQLLLLGFSSALHLLACSQGATLPPATSALHRCSPSLAAWWHPCSVRC